MFGPFSKFAQNQLDKSHIAEEAIFVHSEFDGKMPAFSKRPPSSPCKMSSPASSICVLLPGNLYVSQEDSVRVAKFIFGSLFIAPESKIAFKQDPAREVRLVLDESTEFFDPDEFLIYAYIKSSSSNSNLSVQLHSELFRLNHDPEYRLEVVVKKQHELHPVIHVWLFCEFSFHFKGGRSQTENLVSYEEVISKVPFLVEFQRIAPKNLFLPAESFHRINERCKIKPTSETKVPLSDRRNVLITAALPYVNNLPHLGNIIGCVLSADVFSRYCKLRGYQSLFICGTDEYGTATETKALEENLSCSQLCDKYYRLQKQVYDWFNIGFDYFGRTTTQQQTIIAQDIFLKLHKNDCLLKESVQQLHCEKCNRFLADRYVEGTCPNCKFPDARGDQCDGCGKLINACELISPKCKICRSTPAIKESEHLFLDLGKLQPQCEAFLEKSFAAGKWTPNGVSITNAWLQEGLKPRCITRDLKWGTPVPLEEMKDKVFYVWFDAPIGYISITANYTKEWEKWWKNPNQVELFQFMGKDNVPFHSVVFPSSLLGTREDWTLVRHISTTEHLHYEGGKFSKSRNIGVFGNNVIDSKIPVSVWRYYLLSNRPETSDTSFQWDDFAAKTNSELLGNLGNFANRTLCFLTSKYQGIVPDPEKGRRLLTEAGRESLDNWRERINVQLKIYLENMEVTKLKVALKAALAISTIGNEFLAAQKLDNALFTNHRDICNAVINEAINILYLLSSLFYPFIPDTVEDLLRQLNAPLASIPDVYQGDCILPEHPIGATFHLFSRIEQEQLQQLKQKYGGQVVE